MRHYCNKQSASKEEFKTTDKSKEQDNQKQKEVIEQRKEGVVFPPGCDYDYIKKSGVEYRVADLKKEKKEKTEDNLSLRYAYDINKNGINEKNCRRCGESFYNKTAIADNMSGMFDLVSVPQIPYERQLMTMADYIGRYIGKYVCMDLWTNESRKMEKCGILNEVGIDFLSVLNPKTKEITMIDFKTVRYISVYCR